MTKTGRLLLTLMVVVLPFAFTPAVASDAPVEGCVSATDDCVPPFQPTATTRVDAACVGNNCAFSPAEVTIQSGEAIRWVVVHTCPPFPACNEVHHQTSNNTTGNPPGWTPPGTWTSSQVTNYPVEPATYDNVAWMFRTPGVYYYHCKIHNNQMWGKITVTA